ncbi:MAG: SDR family oxidoreductase, partial [Opitutaceae bacterium]|nr:SDR family oxidoreductase [Opitutaceae bacterium]
AAYLAPAGVRVNGVAPGFFVNERSRKILQNSDGSLSARGLNVMHHTPFKRFGEASELLGGVLWLLNDEQAAFVTGVTLPIDGGFLACPGV